MLNNHTASTAEPRESWHSPISHCLILLLRAYLDLWITLDWVSYYVLTQKIVLSNRRPDASFKIGSFLAWLQPQLSVYFWIKTDNSPQLSMKQQLGGYNALWTWRNQVPKFSSLWLIVSLAEGLTEGVMRIFSNNYTEKKIYFSFQAPFKIISN